MTVCKTHSHILYIHFLLRIYWHTHHIPVYLPLANTSQQYSPADLLVGLLSSLVLLVPRPDLEPGLALNCFESWVCVSVCLHTQVGPSRLTISCDHVVCHDHHSRIMCIFLGKLWCWSSRHVVLLFLTWWLVHSAAASVGVLSLFGPAAFWIRSNYSQVSFKLCLIVLGSLLNSFFQSSFVHVGFRYVSTGPFFGSGPKFWSCEDLLYIFKDLVFLNEIRTAFECART